VSLCVKFENLLHYQRLQEDFGKDWSYESASDNGSIVVDILNDLTVRQIFDYTPAEDDVIEAFITRNNTSFQQFSVDNFTEIQRTTRVKKYLFMGFVCYKIVIVIEESMSVRDVVATLDSPGMTRLIRFNEQIWQSNIIKITLGSVKALPYKGLLVTPYFFRGYNTTTNKSNLNYFVSNHYTMESMSLQDPYETRCFYYNALSMDNDVECVETCVLKTTGKELNKVPITTLIQKPSDKKFLNPSDFTKPETNTKFLKISSECLKGPCSRTSCLDFQVITETEAYSRSNFSWKHVVPTQTSFLIVSLPQISTIEFLTYLLGAISTWTGLSILHINPIDIFFNFRRKYKKFKKSVPESKRKMTSRNDCKNAITICSPPKNVWKVSKARAIVFNMPQTSRAFSTDSCVPRIGSSLRSTRGKVPST
jgi:hypothetical protein